MDAVTIIGITVGAVWLGSLVSRAIRAWSARRACGALDGLAGADAPPMLDHLPADLVTLIHDARLLRLHLQTPLLRYRAAVWHDTPWRRRVRCDEYDAALVDARRALWDWLHRLHALGERERQIIRCLRLPLRGAHNALFRKGVLERTDDVFDEALFPPRPDLGRVVPALGGVIRELRDLELALADARPDPYR